MFYVTKLIVLPYLLPGNIELPKKKKTNFYAEGYKMHTLITGGAGFIGSHLVDRLLSLGNKVIVLDDLSTGSLSNLVNVRHNPNFSLITGSILDSKLVERVVSQVDCIFHLAAIVGVKLIVLDPVRCITVNVKGTEIVFDAAKHNNIPVVFASSSEVYGKSQSIPYEEDGDRILGSTNINRWSYAETKAIDEFLGLASARQGLPVVILRLFNCYGPRINESGYGTVVAQFIRQALKGEPITVFGNGQQSRCFTFVSDTVEAFVIASQNIKAHGQVFNVGTTRETTVLELANLIKSLTKSESPVTIVPYKDYYGQHYEDTMRRVPDLKKIQQVLSYNPAINLEEGLIKTINWCREHYNLNSSIEKPVSKR